VSTPIYKRILLKISGESLAGDKEGIIDPEAITFVSNEIKSAKDLGVEVAMVVGGGNIFRGQISSLGMIDRVSADHMGMLATIINSLAIQDILESLGLSTQVMSAIHIDTLTEPYIKREALRNLKKGRVVILAGGTGNPYVYDDDPMKNPSAKMFDSLSYMEVLSRRLKVMDLTAISLCMENKLPIIVFNLLKKGNLKRILTGEKIGTKVSG